MNSDPLIELTALQAVGALDGEDTARLQALLSLADNRAADELARFQESATLMGLVQSPASQPSPSLKGKIMARIQAGIQSGRPAIRSPFFFLGRDEGLWQTLSFPGVRVKDLSVDERGGTAVKLYELAPGARFPEHHHAGAEECYVLAGDFHVEGRVLHAGDFHHAEGGSEHRASFTEHGCTLLVMTTPGD